MKYWQIAAGSYSREYWEDFIRYGLAFVWGGKEKTNKKRIRILNEVKPDDIVILKRGLSEIVAVGRVVRRNGKWNGEDDKQWLLDFDGWNLGAYCYVQWHKPPKPVEVKGLTRETICGIDKQRLKDIADKTLSEFPPVEINSEPSLTKKVNDKEIIDFLIIQGFRPSDAENLTKTFNRIRLLARYYYEYHRWEDIREHETRTFLIVPLLLALGWAEQQIKIELPVKDRMRADIACFLNPYKRSDEKPKLPNNEDCVLIVESKGFSQGLDYTEEQVKEYASHFPNCQVLVGSNGYCYKVFCKDNENSYRLSAYLNVLKPRDKYPRDPDNVAGCQEALKMLIPKSYKKQL